MAIIRKATYFEHVLLAIVCLQAKGDNSSPKFTLASLLVSSMGDIVAGVSATKKVLNETVPEPSILERHVRNVLTKKMDAIKWTTVVKEDTCRETGTDDPDNTDKVIEDVKLTNTGLEWLERSLVALQQYMKLERPVSRTVESRALCVALDNLRLMRGFPSRGVRVSKKRLLQIYDEKVDLCESQHAQTIWLRPRHATAIAGLPSSSGGPDVEMGDDTNTLESISSNGPRNLARSGSGLLLRDPEPAGAGGMIEDEAGQRMPQMHPQTPASSRSCSIDRDFNPPGAYPTPSSTARRIALPHEAVGANQMPETPCRTRPSASQPELALVADSPFRLETISSSFSKGYNFVRTRFGGQALPTPEPTPDRPPVAATSSNLTTAQQSREDVQTRINKISDEISKTDEMLKTMNIAYQVALRASQRENAGLQETIDQWQDLAAQRGETVDQLRGEAKHQQEEITKLQQEAVRLGQVVERLRIEVDELEESHVDNDLSRSAVVAELDQMKKLLRSFAERHQVYHAGIMDDLQLD